jgi:hypothetical protein
MTASSPSFRYAVWLLCILVSACGGGGGGGGGVSDEDRARSAQQTQAAAGALLRGSNDFASLVDSLEGAASLDPGNEAAKLFLGIGRFLEAMEIQGVRPGGRLRDIYSRSGFAADDSARNVWLFRINEVPSFGQGAIFNSTPGTREFGEAIEFDIVPALEDLAEVFDDMSPSFSWVISANDILQHPLADPASPLNSSYELDFGDIRMASAALHAAIAAGGFVLAYQRDNLIPNDFDTVEFPGLDPLLDLRDVYPGQGNVARPEWLGRSRDRLERSFESYTAGADHIRAETFSQMAAGLLTLSPSRISGSVDIAQSLQLESQWRAWASALIGRFRSNAITRITNGPDGLPLPADQQIGINFARFFSGIDARDLYLKLVLEPIQGTARIGVTSLSQVSSDMLSVGGMLAGAAGFEPRAGDLQENGVLSLRIDAPPQSVKAIDGNFSDWNSGSVKVADAPRALAGPTAPDLGNLYAAVGNGELFLRLDADPRQMAQTSGTFGESQVVVTFRSRLFGEDYAGIAFFSDSSSPWVYGSNTRFAVTSTGLEMAVSLPNWGGEVWAQIGVGTYITNGFYETVLDSFRTGIHVRVQ